MLFTNQNLKDRAVSSAVNFWKNSSGAVTVDWVVLTAGIITFGLGVIYILGSTIEANGEGVSNTVGGFSIKTSFD